MQPFKFWLREGIAEQEIIITGELVDSIMVPGATHEAGHIVAAHHLGAEVTGISVGCPGPIPVDLHMHAIYGWRDSNVETQCIVLAAGPAADFLRAGAVNDEAASGDLAAIEALTGHADLEPHLAKAKELLSDHREEIECIARRTRRALQASDERFWEKLPNDWFGIVLVDQMALKKCLQRNS